MSRSSDFDQRHGPRPGQNIDLAMRDMKFDLYLDRLEELKRAAMKQHKPFLPIEYVSRYRR